MRHSASAILCALLLATAQPVSAQNPVYGKDYIIVTPGLPKTRSGKIMRRILRKIVSGEADSLGDVSTLADPSVVEALIAKVAAVKSA